MSWSTKDIYFLLYLRRVTPIFFFFDKPFWKFTGWINDYTGNFAIRVVSNNTLSSIRFNTTSLFVRSLESPIYCIQLKRKYDVGESRPTPTKERLNGSDCLVGGRPRNGQRCRLPFSLDLPVCDHCLTESGFHYIVRRELYRSSSVYRGFCVPPVLCVRVVYGPFVFRNFSVICRDYKRDR